MRRQKFASHANFMQVKVYIQCPIAGYAAASDLAVFRPQEPGNFCRDFAAFSPVRATIWSWAQARCAAGWIRWYRRFSPARARPSTASNRTGMNWSRLSSSARSARQGRGPAQRQTSVFSEAARNRPAWPPGSSRDCPSMGARLASADSAGEMPNVAPAAWLEAYSAQAEWLWEDSV